MKQKPITPAHPAFKHTIIAHLENYVFAPVENKQMDRLEDLLFRNVTILNCGHEGFYYRGKRWSPNNLHADRICELDSTLHKEMDEYIKIHETLDAERPFVHAFMTALGNYVSKPEELLLIIPSPLQPAIQSVLDQLPAEIRTNYTTDEVAALVGIHPKATEVLKLRMMTNLLEG